MIASSHEQTCTNPESDISNYAARRKNLVTYLRLLDACKMIGSFSSAAISSASRLVLADSLRLSASVFSFGIFGITAMKFNASEDATGRF